MLEQNSPLEVNTETLEELWNARPFINPCPLCWSITSWSPSPLHWFLQGTCDHGNPLCTLESCCIMWDVIISVWSGWNNGEMPASAWHLEFSNLCFLPMSALPLRLYLHRDNPSQLWMSTLVMKVWKEKGIVDLGGTGEQSGMWSSQGGPSQAWSRVEAPKKTRLFQKCVRVPTHTTGMALACPLKTIAWWRKHRLRIPASPELPTLLCRMVRSCFLCDVCVCVCVQVCREQRPMFSVFFHCFPSGKVSPWTWHSPDLPDSLFSKPRDYQVSVSPALGLQMCTIKPGSFYMDAGNIKI